MGKIRCAAKLGGSAGDVCGEDNRRALQGSARGKPPEEVFGTLINHWLLNQMTAVLGMKQGNSEH